MDIKALHPDGTTFTHRPQFNSRKFHANWQTRLRERRPHLARAVPRPDDNAPPAHADVGNIFRQHKALMESGFSYDQASLILQVTERRGASKSPAGLLSVHDAAACVTVPEPAPAAADASRGVTNREGVPPAPEQQQQQHQYLKSFEERLSFLELELLKQAVATSANSLEPMQLLTASTAAAAVSYCGTSQNPAAAAAPVPPSAVAAAAAAGFELDEWDMPDPQSSLLSNAELLDPEVLAIAQALLIRKGLPYSASALAGSSSSERPLPHHQQTIRPPGSIWGRRAAMRQLRAKPWRYRNSEGPTSTSDKAMMQGSFSPNDYQLNYDASMVHSRGRSRSYRRMNSVPADGGVTPEEHDGADLTPYEPSGWAVAGTILTVYAGTLLMFFALVAGTADGSGTIGPADLDMMMW